MSAKRGGISLCLLHPTTSNRLPHQIRRPGNITFGHISLQLCQLGGFATHVSAEPRRLGCPFQSVPLFVSRHLCLRPQAAVRSDLMDPFFVGTNSAEPRVPNCFGGLTDEVTTDCIVLYLFQRFRLR
ncbi:unnamed protein product [Protopolystoma xenopodis]|uniref:Uncharacterized protein n=1 Tax=Protopolystoma xenopodis TaxID=117903 RepID=A0A3S5CEJ9_9PLAT|nr:unnamed protein product [Protopolystoma xenopodis]